MARIEFEGLDELIDDLGKMGDSVSEITDDMLFAGAEEAKRSWKETISKYGHVDTGEMLRRVDFPKKIERGMNIKKIPIYPQGRAKDRIGKGGKRRRGPRNSEKAYIVHYGTERQKGTHFVDEADDRAGPRIEKVQLGIYDNWLRKNRMEG